MGSRLLRLHYLPLSNSFEMSVLTNYTFLQPNILLQMPFLFQALCLNVHAWLWSAGAVHIQQMNQRWNHSRLPVVLAEPQSCACELQGEQIQPTKSCQV